MINNKDYFIDNGQVLGPVLTYNFYPPPTQSIPPSIFNISEPMKDTDGIYNITNEGEFLYILSTEDFYILENASKNSDILETSEFNFIITNNLNFDNFPFVSAYLTPNCIINLNGNNHYIHSFNNTHNGYQLFNNLKGSWSNINFVNFNSQIANDSNCSFTNVNIMDSEYFNYNSILVNNNYNIISNCFFINNIINKPDDALSSNKTVIAYNNNKIINDCYVDYCVFNNCTSTSGICYTNYGNINNCFSYIISNLNNSNNSGIVNNNGGTILGCVIYLTNNLTNIILANKNNTTSFYYIQCCSILNVTNIISISNNPEYKNTYLYDTIFDYIGALNPDTSFNCSDTFYFKNNIIDVLKNGTTITMPTVVSTVVLPLVSTSSLVSTSEPPQLVLTSDPPQLVSTSEPPQLVLTSEPPQLVSTSSLESPVVSTLQVISESSTFKILEITNKLLSNNNHLLYIIIIILIISFFLCFYKK